MSIPLSYNDLLPLIPTANLETVKHITADIRSRIDDFTPVQYTNLLTALTYRLIKLSKDIKIN